MRLIPHTVGTAGCSRPPGCSSRPGCCRSLGAVVAFAGFTVTREGDRLRIRRGLLARREATVPVERVRAVEVVEGVLRLPFGLAALRMEVIGHAKEHGRRAGAVPAAAARRGARRSSTSCCPSSPTTSTASSRRRRARRAATRCRRRPRGLVVGAVAWAVTPAGPWALPLAAVPAAYGLLRFRAAGWRLRDGRLAVRSLRLARTTVLGPAALREWHELAQNPLQRRARLADVVVAFGKQTSARVRHLESPPTARCSSPRL